MTQELKIQNGNKEVTIANRCMEMACKFFTWYTSRDNQDTVESILTQVDVSEDILPQVYSVWVKEYYTPDVANTSLTTKSKEQ